MEQFQKEMAGFLRSARNDGTGGGGGGAKLNTGTDRKRKQGPKELDSSKNGLELRWRLLSRGDSEMPGAVLLPSVSLPRYTISFRSLETSRRATRPPRKNYRRANEEGLFIIRGDSLTRAPVETRIRTCSGYT